jgi:hypothetical protein
MYLSQSEYAAIKKKQVAFATDNYLKYNFAIALLAFILAVPSFIMIFVKPEIQNVFLIIGCIFVLLGAVIMLFAVRKMNMPTILIEYNPEGLFLPKYQNKFIPYNEIKEIILDYESEKAEKHGYGNLLIRTKTEGSIDVRSIRKIDQAYAKIQNLLDRVKI